MPKKKLKDIPFYKLIPSPFETEEDIKQFGNPRAFKTPEVLWDKAVEYFEYIDLNPIEVVDYKGNTAKEVVIKKKRPYTLAGVALFCGVTESYFRALRSEVNSGLKDRNEWGSYLTVIDKIAEVCDRQKFEGAAAGIFKENIISRSLGLMEIQQKQTIDGEGNPAPLENKTVMVLPENGREAK